MSFKYPFSVFRVFRAGKYLLSANYWMPEQKKAILAVQNVQQWSTDSQTHQWIWSPDPSCPSTCDSSCTVRQQSKSWEITTTKEIRILSCWFRNIRVEIRDLILRSDSTTILGKDIPWECWFPHEYRKCHQDWIRTGDSSCLWYHVSN